MSIEQESKFLWWGKDSFASEVDRQSSPVVHFLPCELSAQVGAWRTVGDGRWLYVASTAAWRPATDRRLLSACVCWETTFTLLDRASKPAAKHEMGRQPQRTVQRCCWGCLICSHLGNSACHHQPTSSVAYTKQWCQPFQ